jgi:hypothetical protein
MEEHMSYAPERIYAAPPYDDPKWQSGAGDWDISEDWAADPLVEYIRADVAAAMVAQARRDAADIAHNMAEEIIEHHSPASAVNALRAVAHALRKLANA